MPNFIILTSIIYDDKKLYINPNQIYAFYKAGEVDDNYDETIVQFAEKSNYLRVKETPEEIMNMIDNIKRNNLYD